jgi:8-oxo-dGTP pyrophosphatase MutT (NUDIX family)
MTDAAPRTVFAAATAVVVRDGDSGLEVLMLKRSDHGQFANMWVFPGGRVDEHESGVDEIDRARHAAKREAFEEAQLQLDVATMITWSHWSPPAAAPKRFLTWFFVAKWHGDDPVVDGHEIVDYRWVPVALAADLRPVAPPTFVTVTQLSAFAGWAAIAGHAEHVVERFVTRISTLGPRTLLWEGDEGYVSGDPAHAGSQHRLVIDADGAMRYIRQASGQ